MYKSTTRFASRIYIISAIVAFLILSALYNLRTFQQKRRYDGDFDEPLLMAPPRTKSGSTSNATSTNTVSQTDPLGGCHQLEGADDILIMLKTGATEIHKKLQVHIDTTFKCVKNYLVYSDLAQEFNGVQVLDAVEQMEDWVDKERDEWKFYQQLNVLPRKNQSELAKLSTDDAWALDKFKNYPMLRKSYQMYPDKKWYMTIDADTAIMWPTLLKWIKRFDHNKILFIGSPSYINNIEFAHGGSGYMLSQAAARMLFEESEEDRKKHLRFAMETCCGDFLMANALHDHDVNLFHTWPMIQGDSPATVDFSDSHWCFPTVTWHHVSPQQVKDLWDFQQMWLKKDQEAVPTFLDAFYHFIWPNLAKEKDGWDNLAKDEFMNGMKKDKDDKDVPKEDMDEREKTAIESYEGCRKACDEKDDCLQFSWRQGECGLGTKIIMGDKKEGSKSFWNMERIEKWKNEQGRQSCEPQWIDEQHIPNWA